MTESQSVGRYVSKLVMCGGNSGVSAGQVGVAGELVPGEDKRQTRYYEVIKVGTCTVLSLLDFKTVLFFSHANLFR